MATSNLLDRGRDHFQRQAWAEAYADLSKADLEAPLSPEDLDRLAIAAHLLGDSRDIDLWTRAHHEFLSRGETQRAVRCSYWVGICFMLRDEPAQASGWLARSRRLLDDAQLDCVERGYLLVPAAMQTYWGGDLNGGHALFAEAARIGERFHEADLIALARLGIGETQVHLGDAAGGVALLDEVMASVTAGEVSPPTVGLVYCAVLSCCQQIFDLRRAKEWTAAFTRWCESQPELVPYRGDCMVHRVEIMQLHGAWQNAMQEAQRACEGLAQPGSRSWAGQAFYQQGDLYRLRGEFARAEEAFRQANQWGLTPQPGLALLRLAQGRVDAAVTAVSGALSETRVNAARSKILPAHVEIMLAAKDTAAARTSADELARIASELDATLLRALSAHATAAVLLAEGDLSTALPALRNAWSVWYGLEAPYEAARVRVLMAQAYLALGDAESAALELDAARQVFTELAAAPDLERVAALSALPASRGKGALSAREVEVLLLLAAGKTNRAIASDLVLSEKTVARHVSNIFAKLGLSSRASATAYAYEHGLLNHPA